MATDPLQSVLSHFDPIVVDCLVEATPEWWQRAKLTVEQVEFLGYEQDLRLKYSIASPDKHRDIVEPTERLYEVVAKYFRECVAMGRAWRRIEYEIRQEGKSWVYDVSYLWRD